MSERKDRRGLGRGLSALMADVNIEPNAASSEGDRGTRRPDMVVPIEKIHPNPDQPCRDFPADLLADLQERGRPAWAKIEAHLG